MLLLRLSILILLAVVITDARRPRSRQSESDDNALEESYNKPRSVVRRHRPEKPSRGAVRPTRTGLKQGSKIRKTGGKTLRKKKTVKRARIGGLRRSGPRRAAKVSKKTRRTKTRPPTKSNKPKVKPNLDTIANTLDIANGLWDLANKAQDATETEAEDQPPTAD